MGLLAVLTPDQLRWVDFAGELVGFVAVFGLGVFAGRLLQARRFVRWARENPTEVYKLAEELRQQELSHASDTQ